MPKRAIEAGSRIFFDELVSVSISRLRATGAIRLEDRHGIIAFGDKQKLVGVAHTKFPNGGSWPYFRCPKCGARSRKLWLVEDAPHCRLCLEKLGVRYRAAYGFGRTERLRARPPRRQAAGHARRRPDALQTCAAGLGNRRLDRRSCLIVAMQRARIATRLAQIAYQRQQSSKPPGPSPLVRAYKPLAVAIEAIPDLKSLWQAKSTEDIQIALDRAQSALLEALESSDPRMEALESSDPRMRMIAARLMLKTRQARERTWS
jgi:hypothetical protein